MTSNIIYHDFANAPSANLILTDEILRKGRRKLKTWASVNRVLRVACLGLNALCIACSLFSLCYIAFGG